MRGEHSEAIHSAPPKGVLRQRLGRTHRDRRRWKLIPEPIPVRTGASEKVSSRSSADCGSTRVGYGLDLSGFRFGAFGFRGGGLWVG